VTATEANENEIATVSVTEIVTGIAEMMSGKTAILPVEVHLRLVSLLPCQRTEPFQPDLTLGITETVLATRD